MIYKNIEFYNTVELKEDGLNGGVIPYRFPKEVRNSLDGSGKREAESCKGCELRFVTDAEKIKITLCSVEEEGDIIIFKGDYFQSVHRLKANKISTFETHEPERFSWVEEKVLNASRYSPKLWRIFLDVRFVEIIKIDTFGCSVRPPQNCEVPKLRWLAYGSSITYGIGAINNTSCYIQQAARRIGADVLNLGLPGSCYCEKAISEFIADRDDWDIVTLEVGVNMRGVYKKEVFFQRVNDLVNIIMEKHPDKSVVLINIFPNHAIYSVDGNKYEEDHIAFSEILREIKANNSSKNLHLISGEDILQHLSGLTVDLIHPGDFGHIMMGENLARKLNGIIKSL